MIVKIHKTADGKRIIAICDAELLGKRFEEGKLQLDLTTTFYKGEEMNEQAIVKLLKGTFYLNVVGKKAVAFFVKLGYVAKEKVIIISGIPHAEVGTAVE